MDERIYLLAVIIFALVFFVLRSRKNESLINAKKDQLKSLYKRETVFLCDGVEDLGDNLIQFYGEPFGISVRPGMKILDPSGAEAEYVLKEVYANDKTPNKPDSEIPNGMTNTTIVIETNNFNWENFRQNIKRDKVIALKLK